MPKRSLPSIYRQITLSYFKCTSIDVSPSSKKLQSVFQRRFSSLKAQGHAASHWVGQNAGVELRRQRVWAIATILHNGVLPSCKHLISLYGAPYGECREPFMPLDENAKAVFRVIIKFHNGDFHFVNIKAPNFHKNSTVLVKKATKGRKKERAFRFVGILAP